MVSLHQDGDENQMTDFRARQLGPLAICARSEKYIFLVKETTGLLGASNLTSPTGCWVVEPEFCLNQNAGLVTSKALPFSALCIAASQLPSMRIWDLEVQLGNC